MQVFLQAEIIIRVTSKYARYAGVGLTKVNRMLPSCPSSFHHKQALRCPDGHLTLFLSLISLCELVLL